MKDYQKGVISIFLVIILIPTMVFSGMFVDLSRVKLAKGVATSAADLALNSLMANYDKDLSEFYGLMASCQNIEDFYEESAQFFLEALYSQGLSADDAESLMTYVSRLFTSDDVVHDLFQMEVQTETSDLVHAYKGGNSTEASLGTSSVIIKDQIVEFMKYRAPIEIASNIIDRLNKTDAAKFLGDAAEDEQLVEDKQEYAEAEENFMDAAFKTYKALKAFEDEKMNVTKLKKMLADMKESREIYREVTKLMVSNLNGTSGLTRFYRPTYKLDLYSYDETSNKVYSRKEKDDSGNYVYYIDGSKITSLLKDLEEDIADFKSKRKAVSDAAGDTLVNASIGTGSNQYNAIQWWKKVNSLVNSGNNSPIAKFKTAATTMLDSYAKVLAIKDCTLGDDIPAGWESEFNSLTQSVKDLQEVFLTANVTESDGRAKNNMYIRLVNKLEYHSKNNVDNINPDKVKIPNGKTVTEAIKYVDTTLSAHVTDLDDAIKKLDKLIDGTITNNPYSLDKLSTKADEYHKTYNTWKNNAKVEDTPMAESDWAAIQESERKGEVLDVSKQDILDFKTRLVNVRSRLNDVKSTIESMKFGSKKLINIESYNTAYNAVKDSIGENLINSAIANKATSLFKDKFTPYSSDKNAEVKSYNFNEDKYNPTLTQGSPEFYSWLKDKFKDTDESKVKSEKDKVDGKEDEGNKEKEKAENPDADRTNSTVSQTDLYNNSGTYKPAEFPSELDANGKFALGSSFISGIGNLVSSLVNFNFEGTRDSLYATEYVMDMFSYASYEYEGKYQLYKLEHNKAPTSKSDYTDPKVVEKWQSDKPEVVTLNKTLTNFMISPTNNVLYDAEAEYVLYGETNKKNLASAYVDIYGIRYALNTLSGFQNFWSPMGKTGAAYDTAFLIELAANNISMLTSGIVPAPAIKCVAILLITALESVNDLTRLQSGFPVELYKTGEQWAFSIGGDDLSTSKKDVTCEDGLFYSDYIYLFLFLGFENEASASEMYRRVGDLIQANMRKYTKKNTYMLKNARSYFELSATIRVNPLMLALPTAQDYSNNPKDKNDWCTFEIHETRGYS